MMYHRLCFLVLATPSLIGMEKAATLDKVQGHLNDIGHEVRYIPASLRELCSLVLSKESLPKELEKSLSQDIRTQLNEPIVRRHAVAIHKIFNGDKWVKKRTFKSMPNVEVAPEGDYILGSSDTEFFLYALYGEDPSLLFHESGHYIACTCDFTYILFDKDDLITLFHIPSKTRISTKITRIEYEQTSEKNTNMLEITQNGSVVLHKDVFRADDTNEHNFRQRLKTQHCQDDSYMVASDRKFPSLIQGFKFRDTAWTMGIFSEKPEVFIRNDLPIPSCYHHLYSSILSILLHDYINQHIHMFSGYTAATPDGKFFLNGSPHN